MKQFVIFPEFPTDPQNVELLRILEDLSLEIHNANDSEELITCATYLYIISTAPLNAKRFYFDFYQHMWEDIDIMNRFYNTRVYSKGQEYMLKTINQEVGSFGQYFDPFQQIMYFINQRSKSDDRFQPLNCLLWGFYCSLYNAEMRKKYLMNVRDFLKNYNVKKSV